MMQQTAIKKDSNLFELSRDFDQLAFQTLPVGFIGLGSMGAPMAEHLAKAGANLAVYNRSEKALLPFIKSGVLAQTDADFLLRSSAVIFTCVTNAQALQDIFFTDEALKALKERGDELIVVDHSTIAPGDVKNLSEKFERFGVTFIDAPVTGGEIGAINASLTFMLGGDLAEVKKILPYLSRMGKKAYLMGETAFGQKMKAVNQLVTAANHIVMAEGLILAKSYGFSYEDTFAALEKSAVSSWAIKNNGPKILAADYQPGFRNRDQLKDLKFVLDLANITPALKDSAAASFKIPIPIAETTFSIFSKIVESGHGELGNHSVILAYNQQPAVLKSSANTLPEIIKLMGIAHVQIKNEALFLANKENLDIKTVINILSSGAAGSEAFSADSLGGVSDGNGSLGSVKELLGQNNLPLFQLVKML
jgi:3-hydroxyisobutyrate dehydrogenase-like beta-hydroxyacid dehydrogenase